MGRDNFPELRIPVSTYRLQFNRQFTFCDARKIISYLNDLGISDIYASPYFKAREGSLHGYDINVKAFDDIYTRFIKSRINFQDIIYEKKILIMETVMSSEVNTLGHFLNRLSEKNRHTRDFTLNSLTVVIKEVIAFFPVYRTYIQLSGVSERDRRYIELAVSKAKKKNPAVNVSIFDFLKDVLLLKYPENFEDDDKKEWLDFVMRFQQITGPVMAKGLEDTTFYVYNRFLSLNDVGGNPDRFGTPLETFHGQNIERFKSCPYALITTILLRHVQFSLASAA